MSIENSHGKARVTRDRLRDLPSGDSAESRRRADHGPGGQFIRGNRASVGIGAKRAIAARERATLAAELVRASGGLAGASDAAQLMADILRLYGSAQRALASSEPLVLSSCMTWARETAFASLLSAGAVSAGLTTPQGLTLLEAAQRAENRAERASLHGAAMAEQLAKAASRQRKSIDAPWIEHVADADGANHA